MRNEAIMKAVEWWLSDIVNPKFDNGEPSQQMMVMLKEMTNNSIPLPTPLQASVFMTKLEEKIEKDIEEYGSCTLRVDYDAEGILANCLEEAKIGRSLSWKTTMEVDSNLVTVRHGYGASKEVVYKSKCLDK